MIWLVVLGCLVIVSSMLPTILLWKILSEARHHHSAPSTEVPRPPGPEPASHTTVPSYDPRVQGKSAHVISPKSPQQLEREADERVMKKTLVERSLGK